LTSYDPSQCGKQIDLILKAQQLDAESKVLKDIDYVIALGMCIAGKEWKIIATLSIAGYRLNAAVFVRARVLKSP